MKSAPSPATIILPIIAFCLSCGGRPIARSDSGGSTLGSGGGDGSFDGTWQKDIEQNGTEQTVKLTFEGNGDCEILLDIPDFGEYPVACVYSANDSEMEIQDDECEDDGYDSGRYTWSVSGSTLSLDLVEDDCPTRGPVLPGEWTRSTD